MTIRVGEEIRALSRFIGVQQTAFRKLLKKYRKWTGSSELIDKFNEQQLRSDHSFASIELEPLVAQYELLLNGVRTLYEDHLDNSKSDKHKSSANIHPGTAVDSLSPFSHVQAIVQNGKLAEFDHLISTLRIGKSGCNACYWVHLDDIVELQVLLLQYLSLIHI